MENNRLSRRSAFPFDRIALQCAKGALAVLRGGAAGAGPGTVAAGLGRAPSVYCVQRTAL